VFVPTLGDAEQLRCFNGPRAGAGLDKYMLTVYGLKQ
jgi:hypothetical protein